MGGCYGLCCVVRAYCGDECVVVSPGASIALNGETYSVASRTSSGLILTEAYSGPSGLTEEAFTCEWLSTGPIAHDASAEDMRVALEAPLGVFGSLTVSRSPRFWYGGYRWAITFDEGYQSSVVMAIPLMQLDASQLSGTGLTYTVDETMAGTRGIDRRRIHAVIRRGHDGFRCSLCVC